ncbi:MAG TPA: selenocysteine-specific translation elongation factor [Tissierellaceae bacterium]|nr:selenocysteine-specific translation elongation factor [Tissierellaceae bacterium]
MKHIIIGTAGHIDHGKTSLIKALTGRETDRLKEEKKRGISIELGFTYFDLPNGQRAGIIDVPGHERFIKNMLAGVIGIDIVLLVVAADEGPMPQTMEHLAILDLLGIERGFIVLSKTDLVEEEWLELVEEEVRDKVRGTFLEKSPIVRVSSTKKQGLDQVIHLLEKAAKDIEDKEINQMPRLPVDRSFIVPGFGTVVTGTLLSGSLKIGDEVEAYPSGQISRIRTLQVHEEDAEIAYAGQRVAMNLAGLKREDVNRGSVIAPVGSMEKTRMLDVKIKLLDSLDRPIKNRSRLRIYLGTKELLARLVLLDRDILNPGEEAYAQLRLEEELVAQRKDKFIVRFYSPMFTIGGGVVLEANPRKKRRFNKKDLEELRIKEQGTSLEILEKIIEDRSPSFPTIKDLSLYTSNLEETLIKDIDKLEEAGRLISFSLTKDKYIIHKNYFKGLREKIEKDLKAYHKKYPLRKGRSKEEIRGKYLKDASTRLGEAILDRLIEEGYIKQDMEHIRLTDFTLSYNEEQKKIKEKIISHLQAQAYMPPKREELIEEIPGDKREIQEVFNSLVNKELIRLNEEVFILKDLYHKAVEKIKDYIEENGSITVAEFRDLLDSNRRNALALLEYFDQEKITKREGDKRLLV